MISKQAITIFDKCYQIIRKTQEGHWTQSWTTGRFPKETSVRLSAEVSRVGVYLAEKEIQISAEKTSTFHQTMILRKKRRRRLHLLIAKHCESDLYVLNNWSSQQYVRKLLLTPFYWSKKHKSSGRLSKLFPGMDPEGGKAWLQTQEQDRFLPLHRGSLNWKIMFKQNFALFFPVSKLRSSLREVERC